MTHSVTSNITSKSRKKTQNQERKYECSVCHKRFLGNNDLRKHVRVHTNERPYQCTECPQKFRQAGSLKNHVASRHSATLNPGILNVFICDYCQKVFPIKERLRLHIRTHTGDKPYKCQHCLKGFARGGQLAQHLRTHTGSKPYVCTMCNASFTCSANLKLHINRHLDVRDYICDICGKKFFRRDALKKHLNCYHANVKAFHCKICDKQLKGHLPQHMRIHKQDKPHGCAHCGARFAQRSQLTVHQRIHSGEKPYRCEVCWKAFAHSTALKLHTRRHTGEKPFSCVMCKNTSFSQLPHLKKHMLCIHKTKKPYVCVHCHSFHQSKRELEVHYGNNDCGDRTTRQPKKVDPVDLDDDDFKIEPPMPIETMRFRLAILLKKIAAPQKLEELGFNKRLIDDILVESIESSGRDACKEKGLTVAETLKRNVEILLEWTVPKQYMDKCKTEMRSTEELLEELTS